MTRFDYETKKKIKRVDLVKRLTILAGIGLLTAGVYLSNRQKYVFEDWKGQIKYAEAKNGVASKQEFLDELLRNIEAPGLGKIVYAPESSSLTQELERRGYTQQQIDSIVETSKRDSFTTVKNSITGEIIVFAAAPAFEREERIYFDLALRHELNHVRDFHEGIGMGKARLDEEALKEYKAGKFIPQITLWILELRAYHDDLLFIRDNNLKDYLNAGWYANTVKKYSSYRILLESFRKRDDLNKAEEYIIDYHLKAFNEKF